MPAKLSDSQRHVLQGLVQHTDDEGESRHHGQSEVTTIC